MAVAYESVGTSGWGGISNSSSINPAKPTGLTVGDLMIAHIAVNDEDTNNGSVTSPGGSWSLLISQVNSNSGMAGTVVFYKIATSGDVAASNFAFTNASGEGMGMAAAIYRISGAGASPTAAGDNDDSKTGTMTFTNTITPSAANSLLLFLYTGTAGITPDGVISSYAITNDNPTWDEKYDQNADLNAFFGAGVGRYPIMSGAVATRTATTATGDSTCSGSVEQIRMAGVMVVVSPSVDVTATPALLSGTFSIGVPSPTNNNVATPATLNGTFTINTPTPSIPANIWGNSTKNSSSFTNETKNSSTFTNETKSSSGWTNQPKT